MAYLASRYFGLRAFGKIYGYVFCAVMFGISLIPYLVALDYDRTGSYERPLILCAVTFCACGLMLLLLGPYPVFTRASTVSSRLTRR